MRLTALAAARRRRGIATAGVLAGALLVTPVPSALGESGEPLVPIERFELANGMRFAVVERPRAVDVAAGWLVDLGTADDPPGRTGLAHALEHLLFQGTGTIRPGELDRLYAAAGASGLNALTRRDFTAYFVALPAEKLELWFWLESDRLADARFRDLGAERAAILEERRLLVEASPTGAVDERLAGAFWGSHPYGRPNSGVPQELAALDLDQVRAHFAAHYRPERLTAVLVGPVDAGRVRPLAELYFGRLEGPTDEEENAPSAEPAASERVSGDDRAGWESLLPERNAAAVLALECDCRPQVRLSYPAPPFAHPDAAAAEVLAAILNGRSGRLHRALVLERRQAFAAYARHTRLRRAGRLTLVAEAREEGVLDDLAAQLEHEIASLAEGPVSPYELSKARNRLTANTLRRLQEPSELLLELLFDHGLGGGGELDRWRGRIAAVSPADVHSLARRIFRPEREMRAFVRRRTAAERTVGR